MSLAQQFQLIDSSTLSVINGTIVGLMGGSMDSFVLTEIKKLSVLTEIKKLSPLIKSDGHEKSHKQNALF